MLNESEVVVELHGGGESGEVRWNAYRVRGCVQAACDLGEARVTSRGPEVLWLRLNWSDRGIPVFWPLLDSTNREDHLTEAAQKTLGDKMELSEKALGKEWVFVQTCRGRYAGWCLHS